MTQICGKWFKYMGNHFTAFDKRLKYVGIDLEIFGNF